LSVLSLFGTVRTGQSIERVLRYVVARALFCEIKSVGKACKRKQHSWRCVAAAILPKNRTLHRCCGLWGSPCGVAVATYTREMLLLRAHCWGDKICWMEEKVQHSVKQSSRLVAGTIVHPKTARSTAAVDCADLGS